MKNSGRVRRLATLAMLIPLTAISVTSADGSGAINTITWSDDVVGTTSGNGTVFGTNCASQSPNTSEEVATRALMTTWATDSVAAGYTYLSPALLPADGTSGDDATLSFPGIPGLTATVSRRQVTPASALSNSDPSVGAFSTNAVFSNAQRLQDCAPRPADLTTAPAGMTLARPVGLSGVPAGREPLWNATTIPAGNQLDAALFRFSRPVGSFGLWVGDLETRPPVVAAPGGGVLGRVKLLAADGSLLAVADITPDEANPTDAICGGTQDSDQLGCGNQGTRFLGFTRPLRDVAAMLVIVGDDDSCAQAGAAQCNGISEYLSWIGPMVAEPVPDLTITKKLDLPLPQSVGDPVTYTITVTNIGSGPAGSGWAVTEIPPAEGLSGLALSGPVDHVNCNNQLCIGLDPLPAGGSVALTATGTWQAAPGVTVLNRAYTVPGPGDLPERVPLGADPPTNTTDTDATPTNNDDQVGFAIAPAPRVALAKAVETKAGSTVYDELGHYTPGQPVSFTISVTNTGNVELVDLDIVDDLADECSQLLPGPLPPGETTTYTCTHSDGFAESVTNTATVNASWGAGSPVEASDTADVVIGTVGLEIDKTVMVTEGGGSYSELGTYLAHHAVPFRITLRNTGDFPLVEPQITDALAGECDTTVAGTLEPGESLTINCLHLAGYAEDVENTAAVTATVEAVTAPPLHDTDTALVDIVTPRVSITKVVETGPGTGTFGESGTYPAGDPVTFKITVTNSGDVPLSDLTVADALVPACDWSYPGPLAVGDSQTYTCTNTSGFDADTVNVAEVRGSPVGVPADEIVASDSAQVVVSPPDDDEDGGDDSGGDDSGGDDSGGHHGDGPGSSGGLPDTGGPSVAWLIAGLACFSAGSVLRRRRTR